MKPLTLVLTLALLLFGAIAVASAASPTGSTVLLGSAIAGSYVDADVSVVSDIPVVPYEYAIQNECFFDGKASGRPDSYQQDDIVSWDYSSPAPYGNVPHAIMTLNLTTVPAGSECRVFLVRNNTVVKGSTTEYSVQP